jgi:hypothetical protein
MIQPRLKIRMAECDLIFLPYHMPRSCVDKFRQRLQEVFPTRSTW